MLYGVSFGFRIVIILYTIGATAGRGRNWRLRWCTNAEKVKEDEWTYGVFTTRAVLFISILVLNQLDITEGDFDVFCFEQPSPGLTEGD
jgi:hypothetical protein